MSLILKEKNRKLSQEIYTDYLKLISYSDKDAEHKVFQDFKFEVKVLIKNKTIKDLIPTHQNERCKKTLEKSREFFEKIILASQSMVEYFFEKNPLMEYDTVVFGKFNIVISKNFLKLEMGFTTPLYEKLNLNLETYVENKDQETFKNKIYSIYKNSDLKRWGVTGFCVEYSNEYTESYKRKKIYTSGFYKNCEYPTILKTTSRSLFQSPFTVLKEKQPPELISFSPPLVVMLEDTLKSILENEIGYLFCLNYNCLKNELKLYAYSCTDLEYYPIVIHYNFDDQDSFTKSMVKMENKFLLFLKKILNF